MGKYRITASIEATAYIPTDILVELDAEGVEEFQDTSSWSDESYAAYGGEVEFQIEAANEEDARDRANDLLNALTLRSRDDIEWDVNDFSIDTIEEITPPMDMERATAMLRAFLARMREMGGITREEEEAFSFLLDNLTP